MAKEIERKFLVREEILNPLLQDPALQRKDIAQFYIVSSKAAAVRIRKTAGRDHAVLTVKAGGDGISTDEFEFEVALSEYADKLDERVGHEIAKTRHLIEHNGRVWEVDVFHGALAGLVVAELECDDAAEVTDFPDWVGEEVTYDSRYKNAVLALRGKPETGIVETLQGNAERIASNRAVMAALEALHLENHGGERLPQVSIEDAVIAHDQHMNALSHHSHGEEIFDFTISFHEMAKSVSRSETSNPCSEDAAATSPGANIITIEDPPEWARTAGLTEGLMFAPGDAVFTSEKPSVESRVEGFDSIPEDGFLIHGAGRGHAAATSPHASVVSDAYAGFSDELLAKLLMEAMEDHRVIDQSKAIVLDETIMIGEVGDEASRSLARKAAEIGFKPWPRTED